MGATDGTDARRMVGVSSIKQTHPTHPIMTPEPTNAAREAPEPELCEVCIRAKKPNTHGIPVCDCLGIQPYAMSTYPGEHRLTEIHPNNEGEQFYKRTDVFALLYAQAARIAELEKALRMVLESAVPHPRDHPIMFAAWKFAVSTLEQLAASPSSPSAVPDEREEWRMLEEGDFIKIGDFALVNGCWVPCSDAFIGSRWTAKVCAPFRRRRQPEDKQ
jgi:hypothetical protein